MWVVFVPLPPAPERRDLCGAEAELNEIEEEFFLFCSFSFSVFTQFLPKLSIKYSNSINLCGKEWAGLFVCCYSIVDRLLVHIYLINLEEDCCWVSAHWGFFNFITLIFSRVKLYVSLSLCLYACVFVCLRVHTLFVSIQRCLPSVSVCLAAVFLILGVDIVEDKGPIELRPTNACSPVTIRERWRLLGLFPSSRLYLLRVFGAHVASRGVSPRVRCKLLSAWLAALAGAANRMVSISGYS